MRATSSLGLDTDLVAWWCGGNVGGVGTLGIACLACVCSRQPVSLNEVQDKKSMAGYVSTTKIITTYILVKWNDFTQS